MRRTFLSILLAAQLVLPATAHAVTVERTPAFAGVQAVLSLWDLAPNQKVHVVLTAPSGTQSSVTGAADSQGKAALVVSGMQLREAGAYAVGVLDAAGLSLGGGSLQVAPGGLDARASALQVGPVQGTRTELVVTLRDGAGNPLPGRPVELIGSRLADRITPLTRETDGSGAQRFTVEAAEPGRGTFAAIDLLSSTVLQSRAEVTFGGASVGGESLQASLLIPRAGAQQFGPVAAFTITAPASVAANEPFTPRIEAVDAQGRRVLDYQGTVRITAPGDAGADLPGFGRLTFPAQALGVMEPPLSTTFSREGTQTLRVEDAANPQIRGETQVTVTGLDPTDPTRIQIQHPKNGATVGPVVEVRGTANPFSNLRVTAGDETVEASSDQDGRFSAQIRLDVTQPSVTITVEDEAGLRSPGVVTVEPGAGMTPPQIRLSPEAADAGGSVLAAVQVPADADPIGVSLTVGTESFTLEQSSINPSLYQASFRAPLAPGEYPVTATMELASGQTVAAETVLHVGEAGVGIVEGVSAEPDVRAVEVRWFPVEGADGYRVYVGVSGEGGVPSFQEPLAVTGNAESARVEGLEPGTAYLFAVTAVRGGRESPEKSQIITASPAGLQLTVTPGPASLALQWTAPESQELLGYELSYGVSPDALTEIRTLAAGAVTLQLRDLLPGIPYHLQLTPITVTGQRLSELRATGTGTPLPDDGLHGGPDDAFDPDRVAPPSPRSPGNTNSGVPPIAWAAAAMLAAGALLLRIRSRRSQAETARFLAAMEQRYRS